MIRKVVKKNGRNKAFIGAIIGTVAGVAGALIGDKKKRKAEDASFKLAQAEQNRIDSVQQASAMSTTYANQSYVDQYKDKITLKGGGKVKFTKSNTNDRIGRAKQFKAGGRTKAAEGMKMDYGKEAGDAIGGIAGLATSLFTKPRVPKMINKADGFTFEDPKTKLVPNSYQVDANGNPVTAINNVVPTGNPNVIYTDRIQQAKMGKRITKKC